MKEIEDIIKAYDEAVIAGKQAALATVVHVDGSSYRRPGARMLITEEGMLTGAISGGCLEGDALRKALLVIMQQQSMLVTYDTSDEDDAVIGLGLGCNGIIQVLIEPVDAGKTNNPVSLLKMLTNKRQEALLVTLFCLSDKKNPQPGTCLLLAADGLITGNSIYLDEVLIEGARKVMESRQSSFHNYVTDKQQFTAFTEFIPPAISLVVIGAGNDILPLAAMSEILGWKTTIIDGRPAYAKKERFPASCQVILAKPEQVIEQITMDSRTAVVLMTHNYNYDLALLRLLVVKDIPYTGMLGPKKKLERMLHELSKDGIDLTALQLSTIHSPVGLDIGAETAGEIALSILAEVKAVFASAKAVPLNENTAPIHSRSALAIQQIAD
ncbi:MAG: XdhC/CoxI family protein [Chitinophagaceae bacterium]